MCCRIKKKTYKKNLQPSFIPFIPFFLIPKYSLSKKSSTSKNTKLKYLPKLVMGAIN